MSNEIYDEIKSYFSDNPDVVVNTGKGAQGIKYQGKMFTMFFKGDLMVKLKEDRVNELIKTGEGEKYPHSKDRVVIKQVNRDKWISYAEESLDYVKS